MARCKLIAVAIVVLFWSTPPARSAQLDGASLSVPQFVEQIDLLIARVDAASSAAAWSALSASIPPRWWVVSGDQRFPVNTDWLTGLLRTAAGDPRTWGATRTTIHRRLVEIRDEAAASGRAAPAQAHARDALTRVLSRSEFQQSAASRWREELQRRVGEWIEDLWTRFGGGPGAGQRIGIALAWIASIAALAALGFWMIRTIAQRKPGTSLGLGETRASGVRARELALRAIAAARAGDARDAVRIAYRAALIRLEEQGVWRVDEARTPREYLVLLRKSDGRHATMAALTGRFERVWYGNQPAGAADAAHVSAHLEELGCLRPGERPT
ncbi:MAG TPA: DUF4129 domain-containing protein [Vicinamibacterales bacterium]|nr:DUF4129 domain-containing protein [Vicinamibacterales bacterium]